MGIADAHGKVLDTLDQAGSGNWGPDGRHVLVGSADARSLVRLVQTGGQPLRPLLGTSRRIAGRHLRRMRGRGSPSTPSGYVVGEAGSTRDVWTFTVGGAKRRLTHSSTYYLGPAISPDGRSVAYVKQDAWGSNVYAAPVAPGAERPVTTDSGIRQVLRWFPDSRRLSAVVIQTGAGGGFSHEVEEFDTGRRRPLTLDPGLVLVGWRPDRTAFAVRLDGSGFVIVDSTGKTLRHVTLGDSLAPLVGLAGSPDGARAALLVGGGGRRRVVAVDAASGALRPVGDVVARRLGARRAAALGDGRAALLRAAGRLGGPRAVADARSGGSLQRAAALPAECDVGSMSLSADARTGACLVSDSRPDLWLVERHR